MSITDEAAALYNGLWRAKAEALVFLSRRAVMRMWIYVRIRTPLGLRRGRESGSTLKVIVCHCCSTDGSDAGGVVKHLIVRSQRP